METTPLLRLTALGTITPSAVTASGSFSQGLSKENIAIPAGCDQMLVLTGTLDSSATEAPADLSLDLSDGTITSAVQPGGGWVQADWATLIGATGENADGAAAGFSTIYAMVIKCDLTVEVSSEDWTGGAIEAAADMMNGTHIMMADLAGWAVSANDSIKINLTTGGEQAFSVVIYGEA